MASFQPDELFPQVSSGAKETRSIQLQTSALCSFRGLSVKCTEMWTPSVYATTAFNRWSIKPSNINTIAMQTSLSECPKHKVNVETFVKQPTMIFSQIWIQYINNADWKQQQLLADSETLMTELLFHFSHLNKVEQFLTSWWFSLAALLSIRQLSLSFIPTWKNQWKTPMAVDTYG